MSTIAYVNRLTNYYGEDQSIAVGDEAKISLKQYQVIYRRYCEPISRENKTKEFYQLASEWKNDTKYFSSVTDICMHESYQRIIGMGKDALPLILNELQKESQHWFWALTAITGENPIPWECRGRMSEMRKAWLEWGKQHNLIV